MINNSSTANQFYSLVNSYVDSYVDSYQNKFNVKPNKIELMFLKNEKLREEFLKKRGIFQIKGIDRVLQDILEDRISLNKDSVRTFERFQVDKTQPGSVLECLYTGLNPATVEHEKLLADYFDCSLSAISIVDPNKHIFEVDGYSENFYWVFTESEIEVIHKNFLTYLESEILSKNLEIEGFDFGHMDNFINSEKLNRRLEEIVNPGDCTKKIVELVGGLVEDDNWGIIISTQKNVTS